jgi:predicted ATPase/antitoxin component of RelBE/YafQ-DinJ toxin-antitoxin module
MDGSAPKYNYRLLSLTTTSGETIKPENLTILIGPNNVGKSRILKEIAAHTASATTPRKVMVASVKVELPRSLDELRQSYDVERYQNKEGSWEYHGLSVELDSWVSSSGGDWPTSYGFRLLAHDSESERSFASDFGNCLVAHLTTESRLLIAREGDSMADVHETASLLQALYRAGTAASREVSKHVRAAFGQEVELDFTVPRVLCLRVSDDFSEVPSDPRDALPFMRACEKLDDQGDGFRSFVGISIAMLILRRALFLIDEPEAFLHPPQAFRMGAFIAERAADARQVMIATHSADILRGILSRTQDVKIIRIDRNGNSSCFKELAASRLQMIINDPLLTSARVLDGLFYSAAVVTEADSDSRFYHSASVKRDPDLDVHFVNADNKQTVPRILCLYREMGVRSAGIVDFDFLNDQTEFQAALRNLGMDDSEIDTLLLKRTIIANAANAIPTDQRLREARAILAEEIGRIDELMGTPQSNESTKAAGLRKIENRLRGLLEASKVWKDLKRRGRVALPSEAAEAFDFISERCSRRGLFINPSGELESALADQGIDWTSDKRAWIVRALRLMANLQPDDSKMPWQFLRQIHNYLKDDLRPC